MNHNDVIQSVSSIINNFENYKKYAVELQWTDCDEEHLNWYNYDLRSWLTIGIDRYTFYKEITEKNLTSVYVQTLLRTTGFNEEWDPDFWKDISKEERESILDAEVTDRKLSLYGPYIKCNEVRMKSLSYKDLKGIVDEFSIHNKIPQNEIARITDLLEKKICIETGGFDIHDFNYIAVDNHEIIFVSCGFID